MNTPFVKVIHVFGSITSPLISITIVIFSFISSSTAASSSWLLIFGDKGAHTASYMALGFCLFCTMIKPVEQYSLMHIVKKNFVRIVVLWALIIVFGSIIEFLQPRFGRGFEVLDIVADAVGSIVGIFFSILVISIINRFLVGKESNS